MKRTEAQAASLCKELRRQKSERLPENTREGLEDKVRKKKRASLPKLECKEMEGERSEKGEDDNPSWQTNVEKARDRGSRSTSTIKNSQQRANLETHVNNGEHRDLKRASITTLI